MTSADVPAAAAIGGVVFSPGAPYTARDAARAERRFRHLLATDPEGAWVAVDGGDDDAPVIGATLALRREDLWGLSFLGVLPEHQARRIGGALLGHALDHAAGAAFRLILSSEDPKAMRSYARAGLRLRPSVAAGGVLNRARLPARPARVVVSDDVAATAEFSRHVRGAGHERDLPVFLELGMELLLHPGRGFAVRDDGTVKLLAARDEAAASELLWACLIDAPPGASINVDFLTADQDWAVAVVLEAGLALSAYGPVFVGGNPSHPPPLTPYLPSGSYL
jgi:GNAT superfamily N-acetyltransferase